MRVISWNVRSLRDDPRGVAKVLRNLAPDVVCLQEAPRLVGWVKLWVGSTHLDLSDPARTDSARTVHGLLPGGPLVLGADVNDLPSSPAWTALGRGLVDAGEAFSGGAGPTFPAREPHRRIDGVWVSQDLLVVGARVAAEAGPVSDHLPVVVDLELPTPPADPYL